MQWKTPVWSVAALVLASACTRQAAMSSPTSATASVSTDTAALRAEIEVLNRSMESAVRRGDMLAAASYYANDAIVRTPTSVAARGREEIDRYFTSIQNPKSWTLEVRSVTGTRDLAYQVGRSTLVAGEPERRSVVDFFLVWRRQADGTMKIVYDYYHMPGR